MCKHTHAISRRAYAKGEFTMANTFTIKGKKATQGVYMAHAAYESAKALATAHNGKIANNDGKMLELTFKSNADAKAFADAFESAYAKAHKAYAKAHAPAQKPTVAKGKAKTVTVTDANGNKYTVKASDLAPVQAPEKAPARKAEPRKPARAKGNAFDFGKIKGKTNTDKNRALHAVLVGMGMKDSRDAKYQAIWNARPWANA